MINSRLQNSWILYFYQILPWKEKKKRNKKITKNEGVCVIYVLDQIEYEKISLIAHIKL